MAKPRKKRRPAPRRQIVLQLDRWLDAQKAVVKHVGEFVIDATDMTVKGEWSPSNWLARYGQLWVGLAAELKKPVAGRAQR